MVSLRCEPYCIKHSSLLFYVVANGTKLTITVHHRQTSFKEIEQIRAYNIRSLVGDMGGYMGLFLGYALLNFPSLFLECVGFMKKKILDEPDQ